MTPRQMFMQKMFEVGAQGSKGRYADQLMGSKVDRTTVPGGLDHVFRQMYGAYLKNQDKGDRTSAMKAMIEGMRGSPAEMLRAPTGGMDDLGESENVVSPEFDPGQIQPAKPRGYGTALSALTGLEGNEHAGRMAMQLMGAKFSHDEARADEARQRGYKKADLVEGRGYADRLRGDTRTNKLADSETAHKRAVALKAAPTAPKATAQPSAVQQYEYARGQGYKGSFVEFQTELKKAGASAINIDTKAKTEGAKTAAKQGVGEKPLTPGQLAVDKKFGDFYSTFVLQGGQADAEKGLSQIDSAVKELEGGKNLTGAMIGLQPEWMLAITNPDAADVGEAVSEVVQRNLRVILGAQFTENEGKRLIARAYNSSLDEKINARRVRRLLTSMRKAMASKMDAIKHFEEKGTMRGFEGRLWSMSDIASDFGSGERGETATKTEDPPASLSPPKTEADRNAAIAEARNALAAGADRKKVEERMRQMGIDIKFLDS